MARDWSASPSRTSLLCARRLGEGSSPWPQLASWAWSSPDELAAVATTGAALFIPRLPAQPKAPTFTPGWGCGWGGAEAAAAPTPLPGLSSDPKLAGAGVLPPGLGGRDAVTEGHSSRRRRLKRKHGRRFHPHRVKVLCGGDGEDGYY